MGRLSAIAALLPLLAGLVLASAADATNGSGDGESARPLPLSSSSGGVGGGGRGGGGGAIPRLIIQTGPKDKQTRDAKWGEYQSSLMLANPDFEYRYFDDESALAFVDEHFAGRDLPRVYREAPKFVLKADLFRYAAVLVLGGFYMDMDMLGKESFEPLVVESEQQWESESQKGVGAVFPKEWWRSDWTYRKIYGPGRKCLDAEEHWQVGNYAFAAAPNHPFVVDALDEAIRRTVRLMERKPSSGAAEGEEKDAEITDEDVLLSTGPYMLSKLYHEGRRNGKYADVLHLSGDPNPPVRSRPYGGDDWHKFGPYAEHMLSHSWVSPKRRLQGTAGSDLYDLYGDIVPCLLKCLGIEDMYDLYDLLGDLYIDELYDLNIYDLIGSDLYDPEFGLCIFGCFLGDVGTEEPTSGATMSPTSGPTPAPVPPVVLPPLLPGANDTAAPTAAPAATPTAAPVPAPATKTTAGPTAAPSFGPTDALPPSSGPRGRALAALCAGAAGAAAVALAVLA